MEKLMEGGIIAAPFRLRYSPAPAWVRAGVGARGPTRERASRWWRRPGVGANLPYIKASRRWWLSKRDEMRLERVMGGKCSCY